MLAQSSGSSGKRAMERPAKGAIEVQGALGTPSGLVQLVRYRFSEPPDSVLRPNGAFRIELCLGSRHRGTRASFRDYWSPRRFERIGELFVAPPDTELATRSDEAGPLQAIVCELSHEVVLELFDRRPSMTDALLMASLDVRDARLHGLLLRLGEEARHPGFASALMADLLTRQLALEMVRHGAAIIERGHQGGLASWQLRLIEERLAEPRAAPDLAELAQSCRLSIRQLSRGFRSSRGGSLGAYVAARQIEHAKRLLAAGQSVGAIARTLGFASSSNFCFAFRRQTGTTPGRFRQGLLRH
jgi:AraC family transcriptional regulator